MVPLGPRREPARSQDGGGRPASEGEEISASVRLRGQGLADPLRVAEVDVGHDDTFTVAGARDDDAPGVHDHRIPVAGVSRWMRTVLSRREHVYLIFDRASAEQHL